MFYAGGETKRKWMLIFLVRKSSQSPPSNTPELFFFYSFFFSCPSRYSYKEGKYEIKELSNRKRERKVQILSLEHIMDL